MDSLKKNCEIFLICNKKTIKTEMELTEKEAKALWMVFKKLSDALEAAWGSSKQLEFCIIPEKSCDSCRFQRKFKPDGKDVIIDCQNKDSDMFKKPAFFFSGCNLWVDWGRNFL